MFNTRSKAPRAVKANLARQAETKRARRDTAAAARHTSLEPLRQEIRELYS